VEDILPGKFTLEVSSPGLERVLKKDRDYERYQGELIDVKLFKPRNGIKNFQARLAGYDSENLYLEAEGKTEAYKRSDIAVAKRVFTF
jgi:ribosome maturation factor RimP